jgi:hypothetical protein
MLKLMRGFVGRNVEFRGLSCEMRNQAVGKCGRSPFLATEDIADARQWPIHSEGSEDSVAMRESHWSRRVAGDAVNSERTPPGLVARVTLKMLDGAPFIGEIHLA